MKIFLIFFTVGFLCGSKLVHSSIPQVKGTQTFISPLANATLTPVPTSSSTPTPQPTLLPTLTPSPTITPTPTPAPIIFLPSDLDNHFTKYATAYSVDKQLLAGIAKCESGLNPNAQTEDYAGLFQFSEVLWIQTRNLMKENADLNLRLNPEETVKTAAFLISQNHLGVWPNCSK